MKTTHQLISWSKHRYPGYPSQHQQPSRSRNKPPWKTIYYQLSQSQFIMLHYMIFPADLQYQTTPWEVGKKDMLHLAAGRYRSHHHRLMVSTWPLTFPYVAYHVYENKWLYMAHISSFILVVCLTAVAFYIANVFRTAHMQANPVLSFENP